MKGKRCIWLSDDSLAIHQRAYGFPAGHPGQPVDVSYMGVGC